VTGKSLALALAVSLLVSIAGALLPAGATAAGPLAHCGSYVETGEGAGYGETRILVSNQNVSCTRPITVVRSFLSLLPKRHHGRKSTLESFWTLPTQPGWRCGFGAGGGGCVRGKERAGFFTVPVDHPESCGNQVRLKVGGVLILSWRRLSCNERRSVARSEAFGSRFHGFNCEPLPLRAGGGGAICSRGGSFVELGFE
jgi:hypothetical protein